MATRRSRIKGIANIPQRRKTEAKLVEEPLTNGISDEAPDDNDRLSVIETGNNESNSSAETSNKLETHNIQNNVDSEGTNVATSTEEPVTKTEESIKPRRRTFIKPLVNIKSLHKSKPKVDEAIKTNINQTPLCSVQEINNEVEISIPAQVVINSDSENIIEPQSPTKLINRSRIKAVPRLTQRRISSTIHGSASESEDDTNKKTYKRIKTESACSTISNSNENSVRLEPELPPKTRDFNTVIQRKCRRTEQSNKMAEARRNFVNKFRNKEPDKHKLTMLDLIFYNPTTKPMSQKPERVNTSKSIEENTTAECDAESVESDEENNVPAPQIKIGANGEIVVDEQSLVIENKQTKKDRENLQNSEVIDGDFDTGYGVYKRAKRSKDWSKEDTLFFYKALNTLGTDFSLMVQLFPGRSRRELKMKFKKEEKINHVLVDKALTRPLQFNIKELKEEVKMRQKMKELERIEKEERIKQLQAQKKNTILPYTRVKKDRKRETKKRNRKPKDMYSKIEKGIASIWESDSEDEKNDEEEVEDDRGDENDDFTPTTNLSNILKPTRYGRIPKQKTFTLEDPKVVKIREEYLQEEHQLEPGSLMIVCCQTPTGAPTFKVFMITGSQSKVPVVIPPDVLSNLTKTSDKAQTEETIPENNYTICHDDSNKQIEVEIQDFQENNDNVTSS